MPTSSPRVNESGSSSSQLAIPQETNISLALLEHLVQAVGIEFDSTRATLALRQAQANIPSTATRAARQRLSQAAEMLGIQLLIRQMSLKEALRWVGPETPLAAFVVSMDGTARWRLLVEYSNKQARFANLANNDPVDFLDISEAIRHLSVSNENSVIEWLVAQPAAPMAESARSSETDGHHHDDHTHDHGHGHGHGPAPLTRLWSLLQKERADFWIVVAYAIGIGVLSLATPLTAMALVNAVALTTLQQPLIVLCLVLFVSLALAGLLRVLQTIVVEYIQQRIFVRVVADLAYRLPRVRRDAFDRQHGPELVNRFFDVLTVQKSSAALLLDGVAVTLQTVIGLMLLAAYSQILLGFDLILIGALAFILFGLGRGAVKSAIRESKTKYAVASWIEEMARHPAAFKLQTGPRFALERADVLAREYLLARRDHFRIVLRQSAFALGLQAIASTALLGIGGYLVINNQLTLGQLVAAEIVVTLVVASFTKFGKQLESYYDLLAAIDKLGHLTDLPLEREGGTSHQARDSGAEVRLHDVGFRYEGSHQSVFEHLTLTLKPGERVALLGPNGAGKSTLVDLLFGLRSPTHGHIEIDGVDLRDLRLESLREHIAVVKGIEVFEGSIFDNVRMGREELTLADVQHALRSVDLIDDILTLPQGLRTQLWTGGAPLSLGQVERLMLARAIVGQPRLLVLDETLDDMDQEVRQTVLPAILGRDALWTLLVITHSQDVARLCDRVTRIDRVRSH